MESKGTLIIIGIILGVVFSPITSFAEIDSDYTVTISSGSSVPGCEETNECYQPYAISIGVGKTVTWVSEDVAAHTVTSAKSTDDGWVPNGIFDSNLFVPGNTFSVTFENEGTYNYFCIVHPWMSGIVIVDENYNSQQNIPPDINITVDKSLYFDGDTIHVSGTVTELVNGFPVTLTVTRPGGDTVTIQQLDVNNNKTFETELTVGGILYDVDGVYSIHVLYGTEQSVDLIAFEFRQNNPDLIPPLLLVPSDIIVDATNTQGARVEYDIKAIDDVDGILEPSCNPPSNHMFQIGSNIVTCDAFDSAGNQITKSFTITVQQGSEFVIPNWIKEVASFWCNEQINNGSFIEAIEYLIENEVILVPISTDYSSVATNQIVPDWIKNNACWWSQDLISDNDFAAGIEYLVEQGIIIV